MGGGVVGTGPGLVGLVGWVGWGRFVDERLLAGAVVPGARLRAVVVRGAGVTPAGPVVATAAVGVVAVVDGDPAEVEDPSLEVSEVVRITDGVAVSPGAGEGWLSKTALAATNPTSPRRLVATNAAAARAPALGGLACLPPTVCPRHRRTGMPRRDPARAPLRAASSLARRLPVVEREA
jgi:hypothetical protein